MATLVYSDSDGRDRSFALGADPVTVGRAPECSIRSDDPRVSRMHARFFLDQGGLWIEDLGSTHGIYVGPNKVQRAPVPPGEVVLIGSLLVRLVPASGTMPPPVGLHGTLATWLDLERKNRSAVEDERDAFAKRVGELHQELAAAKNATTGPTLKTDAGDTQPSLAAEAIRMRDEAEARAAALERALGAVQDELMVLREAGASANPDEDLLRVRGELATARDRIIELERDLADRAEWSTLVGAEHTKLTKELDSAKLALDEARAAASIAEHAHAEAARESQNLRAEIDKLRRESAADLEIARMEAAKARDGNLVAVTSAGVTAAERMAELDLEIESLKRQLVEAKTAPKPAGPDSDARVQELTEQLAVATGRAEKAEKELAASQIRAQGAERNLSHANSRAAKAETTAAQLEQKLADSYAKLKTAEDDVARARERVTQLESATTDAPQIAAELAETKKLLAASKERIAELEKAVAAAERAKHDADVRTDAIKTEVAAAQVKLADAEKRASGLQVRLDELSRADLAIAAAAKSRDDATSRVASAEQQVAEAVRRAEDAEKRASAADTMAKAMAKDVAEALRRAAETDTQKRAGARELADLMRRAEQAEAQSASAAAAIKAAEERTAESEARCEEIRNGLTTQLEAAQKELATKLEATQKDLGVRLEAAQRELAAERKTALALVDRKTQLERELAEARAALPEALKRAAAAEQRIAEHEVQIETMQDRIDDLESSLAVAETAGQASLAEAAEKTASLEKQLAEQKQAAGKGGEIISELRAKITELEKRIAATDAQLDDAREQLRAAEARTSSQEELRDQLEDAQRRATDAERKVDALTAAAETADLAIGRAGALQRQLDEALSKLAFLERDSSRPREIVREVSRPEVSDAIVNDRIAAAENRVKEAEARVKELEDRVADADHRASSAKAEAESSIASMQAQLQAQMQGQIAELQRRAQTSEEMMQDSERRAGEAEMRVAELTARVTELAARAGQGSEAFERQLFDAQRKIAELEREVANADNVRSFAAETEREIAQLQRDLRDTRAKLTQITLERDRLAADLRDARGDSETTNRRAPLKPAQRDYDPEATAQADISKYEPIIKKAQELEKQNAAMRAQLAEMEQRLRDAIERASEEDSDEQTHTGSQLPIAFAEHLSILEESIDSLRANMRAASDETAMMDQSDSVIAVSSAVSQAAEHVERARAAIRAMNAAIGIT